MISLDRTKSPPFHLSTDYSLTRPEALALSGGKKLYAFRGGQLDVVKLELIFDAAKWVEPRLGISHFFYQMLSKGTRGRNAFQIAEALDSLGTHLEIHPGYDFASISIFTLRKNLIPSAQILIEMLTQPEFPTEELRIMKDIFLQNLKVNNEKNEVIASKEIRKAIFGEGHPYGTSIEEADVNQVGEEDLRKFHQQGFSIHSLYLVGRLSDPELDSIMRMIPVLTVVHGDKKARASEPGRSHAIPKAGSVQTSIRLGKKCLPRDESPAYAEALVYNHVLGGFFGSRLMKNIREEKGLTYGIYSSLNHFLRESFWIIGAEVNQQNAALAIREIKSEMQKLLETPMPADELEVAKNYFIGSWQSENATLFSIAEKVKGLHLLNLPDDYYTRLLDKVYHMTPPQIQSAAERHFAASELIEIQVG